MPETETTTHAVAGLSEPVEILLDRWGVPHIYAASSRDAFFAQGWSAARDRLWQMDFWRRRGLGLLSEVFGPAHEERDRAARLFLYRGDMSREWAEYGPDAEEIVTAFVAGINDYVRLTEHEPELLPEEFREIGYRPSLWSPEDVARVRSHGLYRNAAEEVARAATLRDFGPEAEALRRRLEPPHEIAIPEGLDLAEIPPDVLRVYELATTPPEFGEEQPKDGMEGSNNWVVSGERTATGRPILANDPHRDQSVPSLRYAAHLSAPGMDVIGAGEPVLPGISIGHNGHIAFGLTIFSIDQEDLYVYETNPENPSEYRYRDSWEPMEVEKQRIPAQGTEPVEVELKFTRHGPVIHEDHERHTAFAVRAAWLQAGMAPYLGSIGYMRARNWDGFIEAMNRWGSPGENQVYADTEGNIGWKPAGRVPRRTNWDGLLPVPGDGRYEWDGFLDMSELPVEKNPARGWVATANEMNLPADYPSEERKIGFEWGGSYRYDRIAEVLEADTSHSLEDSVALQTDYLSLPARRILAVLSGLSSEDPRITPALEMLKDWDCVLSANSAPAALFEVWYRLYLREALLSEILPPEAVEAVTTEIEVGDSRVMLDLIETPDKLLGPQPEKTRDEAMLTSLASAAEHLERLFGPDTEAWAWGKLHHASLTHPLSPLVDETTRARLDIGPAPRGGSGETVGSTSYRADDFRQTGGSSWRVVVDVGEWDDSLAMNSPGQSGNPESPHYSDLFDRWAADEAFPLLYSREKIETVTEHRFLLKPGDGI